MAVTHENIATRLGVATPDQSSVQGKQWTAWIGDARRLIRVRAERLGVTLEDLDQEVVDAVVTLAVVAMARKPDDSTMVDVSVDDGRVSRHYSSSTGRVTILDEWWLDLGLGGNSGAFSTRPGFEPDSVRVYDATTSRGVWL